MLTVLKLGGELLEDGPAMRRAAAAIAELRTDGPLVVVHGGGRAIDADLRARGLSPVFVDGLRVTDGPTLDSVVAVLAGRINTALVAALGAAGVSAVGLTGADAQLGLASPAPPLRSTSGEEIALGLVGVPASMGNPRLVEDLVALGYVPVVATVGVTMDGQLLNVNADVLASHLAAAVAAGRLIIAGSTPGVYGADGAPCLHLDETGARAFVAAGTARDGMVAKLRACLDALAAGVRLVRIVDGREGRYAAAPGTSITSQSDYAALTN
jgi:acetylglutamate kinase